MTKLSSRNDPQFVKIASTYDSVDDYLRKKAADELTEYSNPAEQLAFWNNVLKHININLQSFPAGSDKYRWSMAKKQEAEYKIKELSNKKPIYEWFDYEKAVKQMQERLRQLKNQIAPTNMTPAEKYDYEGELENEIMHLEQQIEEYTSPEAAEQWDKYYQEHGPYSESQAKHESTPPDIHPDEGYIDEIGRSHFYDSPDDEGEMEQIEEVAPPKLVQPVSVKTKLISQRSTTLSKRGYTLQENRLNPQLYGLDANIAPYAANDKPVSREYLQQLVEDDGKSYEETKDDSKWQKVLLSDGKDWTRKEIRDHYAKNADKILKEIKGHPVMIYLGTEKNKNILKRKHSDKPIVINSKDDLMYWADRRLLSLHRVFGPKTKLGFVDLDVHGDVSDATVKKYAREIAGKIKSKYGSSSIIYDSGGSGYHVEFHLKEEKDIDTLRDELRALCEELNEKYDGFTAGIVKGTGVRTDTTTLKNNGNIRVPYALHESKGGVKKPLGSKKALSNRGLTKLAWGVSTDDVKKIYELEYKLHMLGQRKELGDNAYLLKHKYETELNRLLDKAMVEFKKSTDTWFESHEYALNNYPMSKGHKEDILYNMNRIRGLYEELNNPPKDLKAKIILFHKALNTVHGTGKMAEFFVSLPSTDEYEFSLKNPTDILDELSSGEQYVPKWEEEIAKISKRKWKDQLPGGLADKKKPEDFDQEQLKKGIGAELEHVDDRELAKEIAMDHLVEDSKYYDKLEKMEKEASLIKEGKSDKAGIFITLPKKLGKQFPSLGEHDDSKSHVTVLFIGKVPKKHYELVEETARKVAKKYLPFQLELDQKPTYFPPNDHTEGCKVAKMKVISETLHELHKDLKKALTEVGVEVDDHFPNYKPHVTLQYMPPPKNKFDDDIPDGSWVAESMEIWGLGKSIKIPFEKVLSKRAANELVLFDKKDLDKNNTFKEINKVLIKYQSQPGFNALIQPQQIDNSLYFGVRVEADLIEKISRDLINNAGFKLRPDNSIEKEDENYRYNAYISDDPEANWVRVSDNPNPSEMFEKRTLEEDPGWTPSGYNFKFIISKKQKTAAVLSKRAAQIDYPKKIFDEISTWVRDNSDKLKRRLLILPPEKKLVSKVFPIDISDTEQYLKHPWMQKMFSFEQSNNYHTKLAIYMYRGGPKGVDGSHESIMGVHIIKLFNVLEQLKTGEIYITIKHELIHMMQALMSTFIRDRGFFKDKKYTTPGGIPGTYSPTTYRPKPISLEEDVLSDEEVQRREQLSDIEFFTYLNDNVEYLKRFLAREDHPAGKKKIFEAFLNISPFLRNLKNYDMDKYKKALKLLHIVLEKEIKAAKPVKASLSKRAAVLEYPKKLAEQMEQNLRKNVRKNIAEGLTSDEPENWFHEYNEYDIDVSDTKQYKENAWLRNALDKFQQKGFFKKIGLNFTTNDHKDEFKYFGHNVGFTNPMILMSLNIKRDHDEYKQLDEKKKSNLLTLIEGQVVGILHHELTHMMQEMMDAALSKFKDVGGKSGLPGKYSPETYRKYGPFGAGSAEEHTLSDMEFYPLLANIRADIDRRVDDPKCYKFELEYLQNKYPGFEYKSMSGLQGLKPEIRNHILEQRFKGTVKDNPRLEILRNKDIGKFKKAMRELYRYFAEIKKKHMPTGFRETKLSGRDILLSKRADVLFKSPNLPSGYNAQVAAYEDFKPEDLNIPKGVSFNPKIEHSRIYKDKPYYAIWTSTLKDSSSHWLRWNKSNEFRDYSNEQAPVFDVSSAKVYHMNSADDYEKLKELFPRKTITSYGDEVMVGVDWDAFAKQYDGVHLANPWAGKYDPETKQEGNHMIDWDVESTAWFNPKALKLVDVGQIQPISDKERQHFFHTKVEKPDEKEPNVELQQHEKLKTASLSKRAKNPLSTYHKKRDPDKTPEPEGKVEKGDNKHRFVIQNHHASHHHWDLRLENDKGAMSSWALPKHHLPKGKERVMAQQTEDHPISYNKFTGTIPEGEYGAGDVKRHDIGTYELIKWTKDTIKFRLKGKKEHGAYTLHRTGGKSWILMVMKDEEDKD